METWKYGSKYQEEVDYDILSIRKCHGVVYCGRLCTCIPSMSSRLYIEPPIPSNQEIGQQIRDMDRNT